MTHKEPKKPETEYGKLRQMLSMYEKVLHPDIWNPMMKQIANVYQEALGDAYNNANISKEALEIEGIIKEMKEFARINPDGKPSTFNHKIAYKRILQIFKNQK